MVAFFIPVCIYISASSWKRGEDVYLNTDNPACILKEGIDEDPRMKDRKPNTLYDVRG